MQNFTRSLKKLIKLAYPIVAMQFSQMAMGVADTIMSGQASTEDLAAVAIGTGIWIPLFLLLAGILTALTPTVAQLNGEKNYPQIGHIIRQSLWIAVALALFSFLLLRNIAPLLEIMRVENNVAPLVVDYLKALSWGFPAITFFLVLRYLNEGMSNTVPIMLVGFCGLIINVIINYLLIFGHWGFPALGAVGAGWATGIAEWSMVAMILVYVYRAPFFKSIELFQNDLKPDFGELKHLVLLGIPIGIAFFVEGSIFSVIALFIAALGNTIVAAHQIALNVSSIIFIIPLSISLGVTILVAHARGCQDYDELTQIIKTGFIVNLSVAVFSSSIIIGQADNIARLYSENPEVIELAAYLMIFAALYQFSDGIHLCSSAVLRGLKDTAVPMLLSIVSFWGLGFPLGYLLGLTDLLFTPLGASGFWIGLLVGLTISALLMTLRLYFSVKKQQFYIPLNSSPQPQTA